MYSETQNKTTISVGAMSFARTVAADHEAMERGYRESRYLIVGKLLTGYRKFLKDPAGCDELLTLDYIASLPTNQRPPVQETSRLPVYAMTTADTGAKRTSVNKYVRIVDYLHHEGVSNGDAPDIVRNEGGVEALVTKIRAHEKLEAAEYHKTAEEAPETNSQATERNEAGDQAEASAADISKTLFHKPTDISVRFKKATKAHILDEIPLEEVFWLECKKTGYLEGGEVRIVGSLLKRPMSKPPTSEIT